MTDSAYKDAVLGQVVARVDLPRKKDLFAPVGGEFKHYFDIVLAALALVVLSPLVGALWLLVAIFDGRPAIICHKRLGYRGKEFCCLKFRTMVLDSDRLLHDYLTSNPGATAEWTRKRKLVPDPRVTRLGSLLRKTSLDELPQLVNVLRGEMSLVGPRPITAEETQFYGTAAFDYFRARPGITGLWQVSGRTKLPYETRVELDTRYVRTWSIWKDLMIIIRTVPCLFDPEASA